MIDVLYNYDEETCLYDCCGVDILFKFFDLWVAWRWYNSPVSYLQDEHNPHLELTLSSRKKISSVLEHLNRKWGNSNIASGELMLFPYCAHQEDLATYQRWTTRDTVAVADVFVSVSSPSVFRLRYNNFSVYGLLADIVTIGNWCIPLSLRYGWFSLVELEAGVSEISLTHFENCMIPEDIQVKSTSGENACMQKDNALLNCGTAEQYPCNSKDQLTMPPVKPSEISKNDEASEQPVHAPLSQFGRQEVHVPTTKASEVLLSVSHILSSDRFICHLIVLYHFRMIREWILLLYLK
jgi:hypothetical protein